MQTLTHSQCGDLLVMWLENHSSPSSVKELVLATGYNDSPFFGAEKKKLYIAGELVMANVAIVIFAVNQVFPTKDSHLIIDRFISGSAKSVFNFFESKDKTFKSRYEQRLSRYFDILDGDMPGVGFSFAFMGNLRLDPTANLPGQLSVAQRFGEALTQHLDVLKRFSLIPGSA